MTIINLNDDSLNVQYKKNMKYLKIHYPGIYEKFNDFKLNSNYILEDKTLDNDRDIDIYIQDQNKYLYDKLSPKKFAKLQVNKFFIQNRFKIEKYDYQEDLYGQIFCRYFNDALSLYKKIDSCRVKINDFLPVLIIIGVGCGYDIEDLYKKITIMNCIIIEPDLNLFYLSLFTIDWVKILDKCATCRTRITFVIGEEPLNTKDILEAYFYMFGPFLSGFLCIYKVYSSKFTDTVEMQIKKYYREFHNFIGFFDDYVFGVSNGINNISKNIRFGKSIPRERLNFKNIPVFVVANGPSLDADISFIKKNKDVAVIISCGSAIETLYNASIKPDIHVVTERTYESAEYLNIIPDGNYMKDILLVSTEVIHPDVFPFFNNIILYRKPGEILYSELSKHYMCFNDWCSLDYMNPTVLNCGISVALHFNFNLIFLFGADCGRLVDIENNHSTYSHFYNEKFDGDYIGYYQWIDKNGNFNHHVLTNLLYDRSRRNVELLIDMYKNYNEIKVINCSDGLNITNTIPTHSNIIKLNNVEKINKNELKRIITDNFSYCIEHNLFDVSGLFCKEEYNEFIDNFISKINLNPTDRKSCFHNIMDLSEYICKILDKNINVMFIYGSSQLFFILFMNALFCCESRTQINEIYPKLIKLFIYFLEDTKFLYSLIPNYIVGNHLTLTNGCIGLDHNNYKAPIGPKRNLINISNKIS